MTTTAPALPTLTQLGRDLLVTTRRRRVLALARPALGVAAFALLWWYGCWWATPLVMFGTFVAVVTITHDVVHRAVGLGDRATDWALLVMGAVLLESGHAYQATHLQHHRRFPADDDPEGYPAHLSMPGAIVYGPIYLARLWWWALRRVPPARRGWLLLEAAVPVAAVAASALLWPVTRGPAAYTVMALAGGWVYPLLAVYLPHHDPGDTPLTQTRTVRGRLLPAVFLELTYHLEHHLYPQVPSHHLAELGRRLDPVFARAGVVPRRVA